MKYYKKEKGAISIYAVLVVSFFMLFMIGAYKTVSSKNSQQLVALQYLQKQYYKSDSELDNLFNEKAHVQIGTVENLKRIEYLESQLANDNSISYIDTKLSAPNGFLVEMTIEVPEEAARPNAETGRFAHDDMFIVGTHGPSTGTNAEKELKLRNYVKISWNSNFNRFEVGADRPYMSSYNSNTDIGGRVRPDVKYNIRASNVIDDNNNPYVPTLVVNNESIGFQNVNNLSSNYSPKRFNRELYLFATSHTYSVTSELAPYRPGTNKQYNNYSFYGRIYSCKIYLPVYEQYEEDGELKRGSLKGYSLARNFIPCKVDGEDTIVMFDVNENPCNKGTLGMYDTVTRKLYTNAGDKPFVGGEELGDIQVYINTEP